MSVFVRSYMQAEALVTILRAENAALQKERNSLRSERNEAIHTVRAWHRTALKMKDASIGGEGDIQEIYLNAAMSLPFYGAVGEPIKGGSDAVPG